MKPDVGRTILGGFVGTLIMTLMMYQAGPMMGMMKMDIADSLAKMLGTNWAMGMMMHFINGSIIFPLIYAFFLFRFLPGRPVVKGILWGVVLWFLAQAVVMPMMGAGVFSAKMGGLVAVLGSLIGHSLYGAALGWIGGSARGQTRVHAFVDIKAA